LPELKKPPELPELLALDGDCDPGEGDGTEDDDDGAAWLEVTPVT
jgi:hypothetical protein